MRLGLKVIKWSNEQSIQIVYPDLMKLYSHFFGQFDIKFFIILLVLLPRIFPVSAQDFILPENGYVAISNESSWRDVKCGDSICVSVGSDIAYFEENRWRRSLKLTMNRLSSVARSKKKTWVAVGNNGTILTSKDGKTWNRQHSPSPFNLYDVEFSPTGNLWVAVGQRGIILTSTNGLDWKIAKSEANDDFYNITVSESGTWIAVGASGTTAASKDGMNWYGLQVMKIVTLEVSP